MILGTAFLTALNAALAEILVVCTTVQGVAPPNLTTLIANITAALSAGAPYLSAYLETE